MESDYKYGKRVTLVGTVVNILLSFVKLLVGFFSGSLALVADGFHSLSDLASDLVVYVGLSFAEKPDDSSHHFGHGKFETFSAFLVGVLLALAGIVIGKDSFVMFRAVFNGEILHPPKIWALYITILSVVVKEILYRYTKNAGKKINSPSVIANAWHHRSDSFSSIGASLGIAGAIFLGGKWVILDPLAGIIVGLILLKEALSIIRTNVAGLLDVSLGSESTSLIKKIVESTANCSEPHNIRTRSVGKRVVLSLHIRVNDNFTIKKGHSIAHDVEDRLKEHFGEDAIVTVHVEPKSLCSDALQK
ncbi:cation transporter [Thiospirochaeta perfilievii]|uniref:Cation transporter n=1 Tax=Thiospirochaeta perfilievii TaxID=252967 RepID=A0A5C1QAE0_9SPIO|nr:cation diffusion facilitator family transporter [Thiospirochaeta perfilievii]QEN04471.1 cation transporter [Thiospirochaeta perfilievii]